jgi:hypothetical protein
MNAFARSFFLLPLGCLLIPNAQAQYTTPNTGLAYTLADLVGISGGVISATSDTSYLQTADLTIAQNDSLLIEEDLTWALSPSASINIFGSLSAAPPVQAVITAQDSLQHHQGMRFESGSSINLQRLAIIHGGGIKCLTDDLHLAHCTIADQASNATTSAALELSDGKVYIEAVQFIGNEDAAISSAANGEAAPRISQCSFLQNGTDNENRPQINLGPSGTDTTWIRNNTVIGDPAHTLVGGIAFSSLLGVEGHVVMDSNLVQGNRYGITVTGNGITALITDNTLLDNNTQGDPMLGGSGINLYGNNTNITMASGNHIAGNLWGVTLQLGAVANFGDTAAASFNPGGNAFAGNGNNGVTYALYNNTPNALSAMNNCWDFVNPMSDPDSIAAVIFDAVDDGALGPVTFLPYSSCDISTGVPAHRTNEGLAAFPNPTNGMVHLRSALPMDQVAIHDMQGHLVQRGTWPQDGHLDLGHLPPGLYLLKANGNGQTCSRRIIVE